MPWSFDVTIVLVHETAKRALEDARVSGMEFVLAFCPEQDSERGNSAVATEKLAERRASKRPLDLMMESIRIEFEFSEEMHEFFEAVVDGRFCVASRIADKMAEEDVWSCLMKVCAHGPDLRVYSFWVAIQFVQLLPGFDGGFYLSLFHLRRAMQLEPDRPNPKRLAFWLYGTVNEGAYPCSEAIGLGREIMQLDPDDDEVAERTATLENLEPNQSSQEQKASLRSLADRIGDLIAAQGYSPDQRCFLKALLGLEFAEAAKLGEVVYSESMHRALALFTDVQCDVLAYGYWVSRLLRRENARDHYEAARQLSTNAWGMPGALTVGVFHARRALELDPGNDEYRQLALDLSGKVPEGVFLEGGDWQMRSLSRTRCFARGRSGAWIGGVHLAECPVGGRHGSKRLAR